ncbi:hypothetical protein Pelo_16809 [Pelomyxa schiedti]|nr:hypothetical protein Pelo_16809 [Pelomyxa schiedti]
MESQRVNSLRANAWVPLWVRMLQYLQGLFSFTKEEILADEFTLLQCACEIESTNMSAHLLDSQRRILM